MSEEEMQRKMNFIVETLANVTTKIDNLVEAQASDSVARKKDSARIARLEASFVMLTELARSADERADRTEQRVAELDEAYVSIARLEASFVLLTELARSADERADRTEYRVAGLEEAQTKDTVRIARLEASFVMLTELARSADERADRTEYRVAGLEEAYVNIAKMVERIEGERPHGNPL